MAALKITQRKSTIGCPPDQVGTMRALGLKKIGACVQKADTPDIRGMIFKVRHLVEVSKSTTTGDAPEVQRPAKSTTTGDAPEVQRPAKSEESS